LPDLATRLTGSADLYGNSNRRPNASINFVTCHDGFTLRDLVSYDRKHNEANGEQNNDGTDDNRSWNCGAEGATDDATVLALRARQSRALLGTLLLSLGVPMILGGDEMGRTQQGNNNGYCQDNEITCSTGVRSTRVCWPSRAISSPFGGATRCFAAAASPAEPDARTLPGSHPPGRR